MKKKKGLNIPIFPEGFINTNVHHRYSVKESTLSPAISGRGRIGPGRKNYIEVWGVLIPEILKRVLEND